MKLSDLPDRAIPPLPWAEGDNIPWHEPGFSARMLREHLSQEHDAASRRQEKIDRHVAWIHGHTLGGRTTSILDLGCGPGFYSNRLARLGHRCTGIDFSPASIDHARRTAEAQSLACQFVHADLRAADFGRDHGLIMLIYGEFNVFRPADARLILHKARAALADGGLLLLEPHPFAVIRHMGDEGATWYTSRGGLFSDQPYVVLSETFWDETQAAVTIRHYVVDAATADVTRYAQSMQAYTDEAYRAILAECGFPNVAFYPSLLGDADPEQSQLFALVARG
ncbi:MAG: class I SAM-dependent methyltransferase [Anaerolineae bacterium]|nr:class I SAM-dependent methyltransferase [Anaerolineae bacterium]